MTAHMLGLIAAYGAAAVAFALLLWRLPGAGIRWWPGALGAAPARPRQSLWIALVVIACVPVIGALAYGWLRTFERGPWRPVMIAVNQLVIFSPVLLLLARDPRHLRGAMLSWPQFAPRLLVGAALTVVAVVAYSLARPDAASPIGILVRAWHPLQLPHLVQVLLEDLTIGLLLLRVAEAFGARRAVATVAVLFAAGHIPAMLADGASIGELLALTRDVALGGLMGGLLIRSRDIAWFIPLHFTMDMTQYVGAR